MLSSTTTYYRLLGILGILCLLGLFTMTFYLQKTDVQDLLRADQIDYNNVDRSIDQSDDTKVPSSWWQWWWWQSRPSSWRGQPLTTVDTSINDNEEVCTNDDCRPSWLHDRATTSALPA
ncbi:hypothetical protein BDF22DRAFT_773086 [Syncephalis plumigaleata]|nr:hypothetical protein BDF22DRAFT_773086 [Syncephalis plumigaleata]